MTIDLCSSPLNQPPGSVHLGVLFAPASERDDRLAQSKPALGQRVGSGVVPERQVGEHAGCFEFARAGRKYVCRYSEVALQIAVSLRSVEQPLDDKQSPSCSNDVESRAEVAHAFGSGSGFIQNGE